MKKLQALIFSLLVILSTMAWGFVCLGTIMGLFIGPSRIKIWDIFLIIPWGMFIGVPWLLLKRKRDAKPAIVIPLISLALFGILAAAMILVFSHAPRSIETTAQAFKNNKAFQEVWKKAQLLNDQPSADTTPIEFSIGAVHYKVPRNYIANMDNWKGGPQSLVRFKVTFPGFEPYSEKTKDCLTLAPAKRPEGCMPIRVFVIGETPVSDDERVNNAKKGASGPQIAPFGYEVYKKGEGEMHTEVFVKKTPTHTLMFSCIIYPDNGKGRNGGCSNSSRLPNQNAIEYHFYLTELEKGQQIDEGLRPLIESFIVSSGKQ
jgi:hypothetical protein